MAAGWWSPPRTEGSGSWTHGPGRSYRCASEPLSCPGVLLRLTLGTLLQVSRSKSHRANKVLYVNNFQMLLSTGSSPWNHRQIVLWDPVWTLISAPASKDPGADGPRSEPSLYKRTYSLPVCVQEDLSQPVHEEDLDGSAGVLFPFYDPDTHILYLAGKVRRSPRGPVRPLAPV